jgi:hypothetical protein
MKLPWSIYVGVAVRRDSLYFTEVLVGFSPDKGKHFHTQTFKVGRN